MNGHKLYLSITHYDDPKQTIIRKVHTSFLGASSPISLNCEVKGNNYRNYRNYKPTLLEVFTLDFENNIIIPIYKDDMTPPTESQISYIKGICEVLGKSYNEPKTKGEAMAWLNHFVPFYKRKCEENELEWEANHSELMNNYGDWGA